MQSTELHIYIISEDPVFFKLIEIMLKHFTHSPYIEEYHSFIELKTKDHDPEPDLIILDDIVAGAASVEIISYFRLDKNANSTICFFSEDVHDIEEKAIERGANIFIKKPFKPRETIEEIVDKVKAKKELSVSN